MTKAKSADKVQTVEAETEARFRSGFTAIWGLSSRMVNRDESGVTFRRGKIQWQLFREVGFRDFCILRVIRDFDASFFTLPPLGKVLSELYPILNLL